MTVTINARGTSHNRFQIGKTGPSIDAQGVLKAASGGNVEIQTDYGAAITVGSDGSIDLSTPSLNINGKLWPGTTGVSSQVLVVGSQGDLIWEDIKTVNGVSLLGTGNINWTKDDIGLGNVDNTSDVDKPISTVMQTALDGKSDSGHTHALATTSTAGFMSAADKTKLDGLDSAGGTPGASAYQVAVDNGFVGTEEEWLVSLIGPAGADGADGAKGDKGDKGDTGTAGADGASAYEVAVANGFIGTEAEWLASLVGPPGSGGGGAGGPALQGDTSLYVTQTKTYQITNYNSFSAYAVSASAGTASISGDTITFTAPVTAGSVSLTLTVDGQPTVFTITVLAAGVATPTNVSPADGATSIGATPSLQSSAFATYGLTDTHQASRWTVYQGGTQVHSSGWRTDAKTNYTVPAGVVAAALTYTWTVEHQGTTLGDSQPSVATAFSTAASFGGNIGAAGGQGFGVGEYPGTLPSGFSTLAGTSDKASVNYGNYSYSDGSVMVFVPKFYYRIGHASSPRYASYGANAIDIAEADAFADETAANAAGYALHRAFKDGGATKSGFFIDKYLASKNGTTSCKSVQNGNPISLTPSAAYSPSNGMTGCTGILADAVVLARSRGAGVFNVASIFMYDALAKLSLAHGQAATGTTHCAWYDASGVTNFPKGCNTSLKDTNDATVMFTTAGADDTNKPLTGSASNLAKTTHNGQACGVTDVNGAMYQTMLGITQAGASATSTAQITTGVAYVLKPTVALASLTGGFGGATDAWGTASSLAANYDAINGFLPWTGATGWEYFGNGSNQVFSGATSGIDYLRSCSGVANTTGMSAEGTNQFGVDGNYRYGKENLFPLASGHWSGAASTGVLCRYWNNARSYGDFTVGFRAAAYVN